MHCIILQNSLYAIAFDSKCACIKKKTLAMSRVAPDLAEKYFLVFLKFLSVFSIKFLIKTDFKIHKQRLKIMLSSI